MKLKYLLIVGALLALSVAGLVQAQEPTEEAPTDEIVTWSWPDLGLTFDYPTYWEATTQEGFNFILYAPVDEGQSPTNFLGVQSGDLGEDESLEDIFGQFADEYGGEIETISVGDVELLRLDANVEQDRVGTFVGFPVSENRVALFVFSGIDDELFASEREGIINTLQVVPLALDTERLNADLQASLEADGTLKLGNPDAPVKVVEAMDFSCPHCASYSTSVNRLINDYVQTEQVQLEILMLTFVGGDWSIAAANAVYCATEQGKGWDAIERVYELHLSNGPQTFTPDNLVPAIAELGVDEAAFEACLSEGTYNGLLETNQARANDYDVSGTPSILVAVGDETATFLQNADGTELRGGLSLLVLYDHLNNLLEA